MALPKIGDGEQVGDGNQNETLLVGRAGQPLGFFGTAGAAQPSAVTAVSTTAATSTTNAYGYTTAAQADAIVTAVNSLITKLTALGLLAS